MAKTATVGIQSSKVEFGGKRKKSREPWSDPILSVAGFATRAKMIVVVKMNGIVEQREKRGRSPITIRDLSMCWAEKGCHTAKLEYTINHAVTAKER